MVHHYNPLPFRCHQISIAVRNKSLNNWVIMFTVWKIKGLQRTPQPLLLVKPILDFLEKLLLFIGFFGLPGILLRCQGGCAGLELLLVSGRGSPVR